MYRYLVSILVCISQVHSANILHIAGVNATSHHLWHTAIAIELAQRGHNITFVSVRPTENLHPNIEYHHYVQPAEVLTKWNEFVTASLGGSAIKKALTFAESGLLECDFFFKDPPFKTLIDPDFNKTFDLIMFENPYYDCFLPLSVRFDAPVVILSPVTYNPHWFFRILGVPTFHAFPHIADDKIPPLGLWKRLCTLALCLYDDFHYYYKIRPGMDAVNRKYFGDVPPTDKLVERIALGLANIPDWLNKVPLPPNVVPVGGLHIKDPNPLDGELKEFLDGAEKGAILISFGTVISINDVQKKTLLNIMSAVSKLPQKFVWKWDTGDIEGLEIPRNVLLVPWVPQNDLLGHPNLRVFVSHCGGQSTLEAAYHGVPVLGVPAFWDQKENANSFVAEHSGIRLDFKDITEANFYQSIKELTDNPKYIEGARRLQYSFRDQPTLPMDRATFWIEFVIRHKGAPHLRPVLWDLPPQALIFDVVLLTLAGVFILALSLFLIYFVIRYFRRRNQVVSAPQKRKKE